LNTYLRSEVAKYTQMIFSAPTACEEAVQKVGLSAEAYAHAGVADFLEGQREHYAEMIESHRYMEIKGVASGLLGKAGIALDQSGPEFRQFCRSLCETQAMAADQAWEVAMGSRPAFEAPVKDDLASPHPGIFAPSSAPPISIGVAINRYLTEWKKTEQPAYKLLRKTDRALRALEWFLTPEKLVPLVRRADVKNFLTTLRQLPVDYERLRGEKTIDQVIEFGRETRIRSLAGNTIAGIFSATRKFFDWAVDLELCPTNPASGIKAPVKHSRHYLPFEQPHLEKLFSMPLFLGCMGPRRVGERGTHLIRDWRYWIPLIGYFTGARIREICQLRVSDIKVLGDIAYFDFNDDGDKSLKTAAARRKVPIHNNLKALGFLSFVEHVGKSGATSLWVRLPAAIKGDCAHKPGEYFNALIREALGADHLGPRSHVFHSFRHTMKDSRRESSVSAEAQDALLGHEGKGAGAGYGKGLSLQRLNEEIQKVRQPYNLDGLRPWTSQ
jgi:integrase